MKSVYLLQRVSTKNENHKARQDRESASDWGRDCPHSVVIWSHMVDGRGLVLGDDD
jgi:hypothetical protein